MEQQLLRLMYYLMCSLLILFYIKKIYLLYFTVIYLIYIIIILISIIICFIFIIIPQTSWCNRITALSLYSNRLYIYIIISRSSALLINVLLIFDIHDLSGRLFFKIGLLWLALSSLSPSTVILPFTAIYVLQ